MPAKCGWLESSDKPCIHIQIEGMWTIEEWLSAANAAGRLASEVTSNVSVIIEYQAAETYIPKHLFEFVPRAVSTFIMTSPRVNPVVVVNQKGVLRMTNELFNRLYQIDKVRYADTLADAIEIAKNPASV